MPFGIEYSDIPYKTQEFKWCPFCGKGEVEPLQLPDNDWVVRCGWCGSQGEPCSTKIKAKECWNKRA